MRKANATAQKPDRYRRVSAAASAVPLVAATARCADGRSLQRYQTLIPPSTTRSTPVTYALSSDTRNSAAFATSSGCPKRPRSVLLRISLPKRVVLQLPSRRVGFDETRRNRVDANPMLAPLERELPGHPDDRRLVRRVR